MLIVRNDITTFYLCKLINYNISNHSRYCKQPCETADMQLSLSAPKTQDVWPKGQACFKLDIALVAFVSSQRRGKKPLQRI